MTVAGRYFDGVSSQGVAADFSLQGSWLHIAGAGFARDVPLDQLRFAASRGAAPARISIEEGGLCELPNDPGTRALLAELGARPSLADRLETHLWTVIGTLVVFIALMIAAWQWGIPWATDRLVEHLPLAWDRRLGDAAFDQLTESGFLQPSALPPARQQDLRRRFDALRKPPDAPDYRIVFRKLDMPNAFALPGGTIVVGDELVALDPGHGTAMMTVLGHELGHVAYRHSLHALVRTTLYSALAAWYFGDVSSILATAGAGFATLRYSRAAEDQADQYALRLMRENSVSTRPAAALFEKLAAQAPSQDAGKAKGTTPRLQLPGYLSTHPDIRDRIALFEHGDDRSDDGR